jgi:hypothetical protein
MVGANVFSFFCLFTAPSGGEFYFIYGDLILSCPAQFTKKAQAWPDLPLMRASG